MTFALATTQSKYPVLGQNANYPLFTQYSTAEITSFKQVFVFDKFRIENALRLRKQLAPAAAKGDVIAQYYTAKTFDWYEFGRGNPKDIPTAMNWYIKVANQNYAESEFFLYQVFRYQLMNNKKDDAKAKVWLLRANQHAGNTLAARVSLELARLNDSTRPADEHLSTLKPQQQKVESYIRHALQFDPNNQQAIDWLSSLLLTQKRYTEAASFMQRSQNYTLWIKLAELYETGLGVKVNYTQAAKWYLMAALAERKSDFYPVDAGHIYLLKTVNNLYRMLCQQKITRSQVGSLYTDTSYRNFLQNQQNCQLPSVS